MKKIFFHLVLVLAAALLLSTPVQAQSGSTVPYQEGLHYFLIEEAPPLNGRFHRTGGGVQLHVYALQYL